MNDPISEPPNPFYQPLSYVSNLVRRRFIGLMTTSFGWTFLPSSASGQEPRRGGGRAARDEPEGEDSSKARGPAFQGDYILPDALKEFAALSLILGSATDKSITASVLANDAMEGFLDVGIYPGKYVHKTPLTPFPTGKPAEIVLEMLKPNTEYYYRLTYRKLGESSWTQRAECRFATQRTPGSTFTFTIQGDSHPERPQSSHPDLYARTLQTAAADHPDFHICIGDDFSVARLRTVSPEALARPYLLQRPFLGLIGQTAPVFLINGNHEQASLFNYNQTDARRAVAVGAQVARNRLFPLPVPNRFYSGNTEPLKDIGLLKDYVSWTWGDALFVVLDNYWHSPAQVDSGLGENGGKGSKGEEGEDKKNRDWWAITIGDAQYQWLKKTLETSKANYKFVFAHHVLGTGRGGIEEANLYEWGGNCRRNEGTFPEKRPGWELPIHQLMAKHKVNIFFQGHDHLYCQQEKDGVIYQEIPMPSDHGYVAYNEDRYQSGMKLPSSGYLRVNVTPQSVKVEYVRSFLPKDEGPEHLHGGIAHRYEVKPIHTI